MSITTNFLGIPVDGDITKPDRRTPQLPLTELEPLLRAVLGDEMVVEFGWKQYTPYFNDGEPCTFSVDDLWFRTVSEPDTDDEDDQRLYELELYGHPTLAPQHWNGRTYVSVDRDPATIATYDRCKALSDAIGSGAFDDVLLESFGDHARVKVARAGISVEFYEHD